jgi:hypothetical protein
MLLLRPLLHGPQASARFHMRLVPQRLSGTMCSVVADVLVSRLPHHWQYGQSRNANCLNARDCLSSRLLMSNPE